MLPHTMKADSAILLRDLLSLQQKLERMEQVHCSAFGVSVLQSRLLSHLSTCPVAETELSRIALKLMLSKATISNSLANLKEKGLIHEKQHPEDGRKKQIQLSQRGKETAQRLQGYLLSVISLFDQTTKVQKQQLSKSLQTLLKKLAG